MFMKNSFTHSHLLTALILIIGVMLPGIVPAGQSFCDFQYITNFEQTQFDRLIWFWTPDTLDGPVHSNDRIGIKYSPHFLDVLSTSRPDFANYQGNPFLEFPPLTGAPIRHFPEQFTAGREEGLIIGDIDEGFQYRLVLNEQDALIYAWRNGTPFDEDMDPDQEIQIDDNPCLFFDSPLELTGVLDGVLTVGCSRDIYLIDNIRYEAADRITGRFDPEECDDILGIVSEQNIIIANTWANGFEDGFYANRGDHNRHSIVINGALLAMDESFTFEDHNDEWDRYQGPTPDERGYIYLTGTMAQLRRGYVHRSNHVGTGYGKSYIFDARLSEILPPFFPEIPQQDIPGDGNYLILNAEGSPYRVVGGEPYDSINAAAGTEIILLDDVALACEHLIEMEGEVDASIVITREDPDEFPDFPGLAMRGHECEAVLSHVHFGPGAKLRVEGGLLTLENCILEGGIQFRGLVTELRMVHCRVVGTMDVLEANEVTIDSCEFTGSVAINTLDQHGNVELSHSTISGSLTLRGRGEQAVSRCIVENGIILNGRATFMLYNNSVVGAETAGLMVESASGIVAVNNIFAFNRVGIELVHRPIPFQPLLNYNDVWGNAQGDYIIAEPGEGSISVDPCFVDRGNGYYNLRFNSPCIDAGDPNSPLDPDSSRADIGALPFDHTQSVEDDAEIARDLL